MVIINTHDYWRRQQYLINSIWNHIVRKQTLSINPDGGFICETNGKKHYLKDLLEGM